MSHLSLVTAHQKRTQLLLLILVTSLKSTHVTFCFVPLTSDIDECSADSSPCDENADCTNSDGSYSCTCKQGFNGDGTLCDGLLKHVYNSTKNSTKIAAQLILPEIHSYWTIKRLYYSLPSIPSLVFGDCSLP